MNKTTEILVGISNQTGMQLNEILNMMSKYYMYRNVLDLFLMFLIFLIMGLSVYLIYRYCKDKFEDEKYFDMVKTEKYNFSFKFTIKQFEKIQPIFKELNKGEEMENKWY